MQSPTLTRIVTPTQDGQILLPPDLPLPCHLVPGLLRNGGDVRLQEGALPSAMRRLVSDPEGTQLPLQNTVSEMRQDSPHPTGQVPRPSSVSPKRHPLEHLRPQYESSNANIISSTKNGNPYRNA